MIHGRGEQLQDRGQPEIEGLEFDGFNFDAESEEVYESELESALRKLVESLKGLDLGDIAYLQSQIDEMKMPLPDLAQADDIEPGVHFEGSF